VNDTLIVPPRVPLVPLEVAKKPMADEVLRVSVVVPLLVALFPNWSWSWRLSVTLVVLLAVAEGGLGVMATLDATAGFTVKALELTGLVTPLMLLGVAVNV